MLAILVALSGRKLHGYELRKQIEEETEYDIPTGTLYRNLAKMLDAGYIEEVTPPANADERRRYYTTTGLGERVADAEIERMMRYVQVRRPDIGLNPGLVPSEGGMIWSSS
jgi:DNA-binding PadR family transcriptional regulator